MSDTPYYFHVVTLFPEMFQALNESIPGRAIHNDSIRLRFWNPRDYAHDKQRTVDDKPYGGGPGMVMKPQPLNEAIQAAKAYHHTPPWVIQLTPQGQVLTQDTLQRLAHQSNLILVAGRYEGIDERVIQLAIDQQISIGDYVLSGGELPAMVVIDGITRLLPNVLGDENSAAYDSFSHGLLDHPHYTRPRTYHQLQVPDILLSGDHQAIKQWRYKKSFIRTCQKRPDLLKNRQLTAIEKQWLQSLKNERGHSDE